MADPVEPVIPAQHEPAPVPVASPEPPVATAPVESAAPVEAPAAPVEPPTVAETPSLLESFTKPEEKPAEAKPAEPAKVETKPEEKLAEAKPAEPAKVEAKPEEKPAEPAAPPEKVEWKFELPETIKPDEPRMAQFTTLLDGLIAPKEGETRAEMGQRLLNLHNEAMVAYDQSVKRQQQDAFIGTRKAWENEVKSDPELGGAGHDTAMRAIARMRDLLVPEDKQAAFDMMLRVTGVGDHPEFLRVLHRAARYFDEPRAPTMIGKPTKTNGQRSGAAVLYDNPRSNMPSQG